MTRPIVYDEINPKIRRTVRWLQQEGFETFQSGDGENYGQCDEDAGLTFPYVFIWGDIEDADLLASLCEEVGIPLAHYREMANGEVDLTPGAQINLYYDPVNDAEDGIRPRIEFTHCNDDLLPEGLGLE